MTGEELIKLMDNLDEEERKKVLEHMYERYFNKNMPQSSIVILHKEDDPQGEIWLPQ